MESHQKKLKCLAVEKPLVSIGIPTYNRYDQLRVCLEHVYSQDYSNLDILISDNNPDSALPSWLSSLVKEKRNTTLIKQNKNIGLAANYDFVRSNRNGDYILVLHDDDTIPANYISSLMVPLLSDHSIALSGPIGRRYMDSEYWYTYQQYSSLGKNQLQRLRELARLAFENPWGFEHLMYGIYRREALPASFKSGQWRSIVLFFFLISIHGSIWTQPDCIIEKKNISDDIQKYAKATYVTRLRVLRYFLSRRQEERITILARLFKNIVSSKYISFDDKLLVLKETLQTYLANRPEETPPPFTIASSKISTL